MVIISFEPKEVFDPINSEFTVLKGGVAKFEHTLKAISEWEAEFKKPFLTSDLTKHELKSYFVYMCLDDWVRMEDIGDNEFNVLCDYLKDNRTATIINSSDTATGMRVITSEVIYAILVNARIPFDVENWNFNRLLTLLEVISIQNSEPKKMSRDDIYRQNRELNKLRKEKYNTKG